MYLVACLYFLYLPPPIMYRRCLSVCLLATSRKNFRTDLHEIFREGWQWADEQTIKFWWRSGYGSGPDPYRDTGKTCLGGGMHFPSASSLCLRLPFVEVNKYFAPLSNAT